MLSVTSLAASAQTTKTTETKRFEVISVEGNDVVVKLPEGTRSITVPPDFRFTVDGQQLAASDLKPGMKGTATVTTTTTMKPVTVTEVKNGTVMQVTGSSMIVRTPEGIKSFTEGDIEKRGIKIVRNGQPAQISDFRSGDQLTATIITSRPPRAVTEKQVEATLARATSSAAGGAATGAATGAAAAPSTAGGAESASASAPRRLPKTASPVPLVGLAGAASFLLGAALTIRRRSRIG
jgi:hypothetical protein